MNTSDLLADEINSTLRKILSSYMPEELFNVQFDQIYNSSLKNYRQRISILCL